MVGLCPFVFSNNQDNYCRKILGNKIMVILGKLSYGVYLTHITVITFKIYSQNFSQGYFYGDIIPTTITVICLSYIYSFILHIICEAPIANVIYELFTKSKF